MSDAIREAFEALDDLYQTARASTAVYAPDMDPLMEKVKAALSANGGEAITPVWDNKVLVSNIVRAFWRRIYTYKDRYPAKELPREVPVELYCAMSTALMHLDNESLNPKHPAPPSVAVPDVTAAEGLISIVEGIQGIEHGTWRDDNGVRLKDTKEWVQFYLSVRNGGTQQSFDPEKLASALREIEGTVNRTATSDQFIRHLKKIATDALTAAPQPDHITDAGKVVQAQALEWSDPQKPNDQCSYDHVTADTPFGRFLITWKSWKEYDEPTIDETPWGEFGGVGCDLADAKNICEREYFARLRASQQEDKGSEFAAFISRGLRDTAGDDGEGE